MSDQYVPPWKKKTIFEQAEAQILDDPVAQSMPFIVGQPAIQQYVPSETPGSSAFGKLLSGALSVLNTAAAPVYATVVEGAESLGLAEEDDRDWFDNFGAYRSGDESYSDLLFRVADAQSDDDEYNLFEKALFHGGGFFMDAALDPLTWVTFAAGAAAKGAIKPAVEELSKDLLQAGGAKAVARAAGKEVQQRGFTGISDELATKVDDAVRAVDGAAGDGVAELDNLNRVLREVDPEFDAQSLAEMWTTGAVGTAATAGRGALLRDFVTDDRVFGNLISDDALKTIARNNKYDPIFGGVRFGTKKRNIRLTSPFGGPIGEAYSSLSVTRLRMRAAASRGFANVMGHQSNARLWSDLLTEITGRVSAGRVSGDVVGELLSAGGEGSLNALNKDALLFFGGMSKVAATKGIAQGFQSSLKVINEQIDQRWYKSRAEALSSSEVQAAALDAGMEVEEFVDEFTSKLLRHVPERKIDDTAEAFAKDAWDTVTEDMTPSAVRALQGLKDDLVPVVGLRRNLVEIHAAAGRKLELGHEFRRVTADYMYEQNKLGRNMRASDSTKKRSAFLNDSDFMEEATEQAGKELGEDAGSITVQQANRRYRQTGEGRNHDIYVSDPVQVLKQEAAAVITTVERKAMFRELEKLGIVQTRGFKTLTMADMETYINAINRFVEATGRIPGKAVRNELLQAAASGDGRLAERLASDVMEKSLAAGSGVFENKDVADLVARAAGRDPVMLRKELGLGSAGKLTDKEIEEALASINELAGVVDELPASVQRQRDALVDMAEAREELHAGIERDLAEFRAKIDGGPVVEGGVSNLDQITKAIYNLVEHGGKDADVAASKAIFEDVVAPLVSDSRFLSEIPERLLKDASDNIAAIVDNLAGSAAQLRASLDGGEIGDIVERLARGGGNEVARELKERLWELYVKREVYRYGFAGDASPAQRIVMSVRSDLVRAALKETGEEGLDHISSAAARTILTSKPLVKRVGKVKLEDADKLVPMMRAVKVTNAAADVRRALDMADPKKVARIITDWKSLDNFELMRVVSRNYDAFREVANIKRYVDFGAARRSEPGGGVVYAFNPIDDEDALRLLNQSYEDFSREVSPLRFFEETQQNINALGRPDDKLSRFGKIDEIAETARESNRFKEYLQGREYVEQISARSRPEGWPRAFWSADEQADVFTTKATKQAIDRLFNVAADPGANSSLIKIYDALLLPFKATATVYQLGTAFMARNFIGGFWNNVAGGVSMGAQRRGLTIGHMMRKVSKDLVPGNPAYEKLAKAALDGPEAYRAARVKFYNEAAAEQGLTMEFLGLTNMDGVVGKFPVGHRGQTIDSVGEFIIDLQSVSMFESRTFDALSQQSMEEMIRTGSIEDGVWKWGDAERQIRSSRRAGIEAGVIDPSRLNDRVTAADRMLFASRNARVMKGTIADNDRILHKFARTMTRNNEQIEISLRTAAVLEGMYRSGRADFGAMMAKAIHFDYGDLSAFERNVLKRVIPFYTWMRRNTAYQMSNFIHNPGSFNNSMRIHRSLQDVLADEDSDQSGVPDWAQDAFGYVSRFTGAGGGMKTVIRMETPKLDFFKMLNGDGWIPGGSVMETAVGGASPIIKTGVALFEGGTGADLGLDYGRTAGKAFEDYDPADWLDLSFGVAPPVRTLVKDYAYGIVLDEDLGTGEKGARWATLAKMYTGAPVSLLPQEKYERNISRNQADNTRAFNRILARDGIVVDRRTKAGRQTWNYYLNEYGFGSQ
jgi:hypothetical protein